MGQYRINNGQKTVYWEENEKIYIANKCRANRSQTTGERLALVVATWSLGMLALRGKTRLCMCMCVRWGDASVWGIGFRAGLEGAQNDRWRRVDKESVGGGVGGG